MKNRDVLLAKAALVSILLLVAGLSAQSQSPQSKSGQWRIAGQNLNNTWSQPAEHSISPANVKELKPKWVFTTGGDVSATPTVDGDAVYFPDWAGNLFAVKKDSGRLIWSHKISDYDGVDGAISRVSPAVDGNQVIIGDILSGKKVHNGANVMSVDRESGTLRWMTRVDDHPAAIITGSPVVFHGVVYIGVSSSEETLALDPAYPCCSFRGSIVALDENTGAMLWKTFDMPDNGGRPGDIAAVQFGNRLRLIRSAVRSSLVLATTTLRPQMWRLARTLLRQRTASQLTISSTPRLRLI